MKAEQLDETFSGIINELRDAFEELKVVCVGTKDAVIKFNANGKLLAVIPPKKQHPFKKFF